MNNIKSFVAIVLIVYFYIFDINTFSQDNYRCNFNEISATSSSLIGGNHKPERTDGYTGTNENSYFPVLVVFVQFATGEPYSNSLDWPAGGSPTFLNNIIASTRNNSYPNGEWWNAYSEATARLSDYWMEVSRGHFHVIGNAYSITLPYSASAYQTFWGSDAIRKINDDIYHELEQVIPQFDWPFYDMWSKSGSTFVNTPDGYIDMIYIVHRSWANVGGMPAGGIACLDTSFSSGVNYIIPNTGLRIRGYVNDVDEYGSGLRMTPGSYGGVTSQPPMGIKSTVSFSGHEHGHYLWGSGHARYGKMMGTGNEFGFEEYLSPWELIKLGYMAPRVVDYERDFSYNIGDFSSRNAYTEGEVLQVPVSGNNEFFLIANRQKVSNYDKIMWGDTCHDDPYFALSNDDYGKGIYIYHTNSEYNWPPYNMDQECADGLWNWTYIRNEAPDWEPTNFWLPYFEKSTHVYDINDEGAYGLTARDGKSLFANGHLKWFSVGQKQDQQYHTGTDRVFTNISEAWTSREWKGDRWDAWRVGYNQIFSPYSSPSTVSWNNSQTGIFVYLESMSGNTANLKIYKVGQGGWDLTAILAATPPSKPMLYRPVELFNCNGTYGFPRITWDNNLEPDMESTGLNGRFKRYKIYRAVSSYPDIAPSNYTYVGTYDDYTLGDTANFIDNDPYGGVTIYCGSEGGTEDSDYWMDKRT